VGVKETAFSSARDFMENRFVYTVVSPRARGLSIGVNVNPDKRCNFDCLYCEVDRSHKTEELRLDPEVMSGELQNMLSFVAQGRLRERPWYRSLPEELLQLRHVALSGDGEPTCAPNFTDAVQTVIHVRALGGFPFFKIGLLTNASCLDLPHVQATLKCLHKSDEIWAKLDAGTQGYLDKLTRPDGVPLDRILSNILSLSRQRPVIIQSLSPAVRGEEPAAEEIQAYAERLRELKAAGAQIPLVQIYSATRPMFRSECGHLPLKTLSHIAQKVRQVAKLPAEVF
jgi:wyosine [tRNA(Phe)-imidazoG37] synthetase (radical SAM superfamily)